MTSEAARARVYDGVWVLVAAGGGLILLVTRFAAPGPGWIPGSADVVFGVDAAIGAAASALLIGRRRHPAAVALILTVPLMLSRSAQIACLMSVYNASVRCRPRAALALAALHQAAFAVFAALFVTEYPVLASWLLVLTYHLALVAVGLYLRARQELITSLHERVAQAEAAQQLMADQARRAERTRIAAEMHDVLAHRVALVALHAGALEIRPDQSPAQVKATATLIRSTARKALTELRDVIGVLRADEPPDAPHEPPPTLDDIARLIEEFRHAGLAVELDMRVDEPGLAPGALGRDTYRIVREGLSNVTKHASGTRTTVSLTGRPGEGLNVEVRNRLPLGYQRQYLPGTSGLAGSGLGLTALAERVTMAGGTLRHGPDPHGDFVLTAVLNWTRNGEE